MESNHILDFGERESSDSDSSLRAVAHKRSKVNTDAQQSDVSRDGSSSIVATAVGGLQPPDVIVRRVLDGGIIDQSPVITGDAL
jgi:hypothetical protein